MQAAFFAAISRINHPAVKATYAIPMAALDTPKKRLKFSREGCKKGVLDVNVDYPNRLGWHGARLEFKAGDNTTTPEQNEWIARHLENRYYAVVVRSKEEALNVFLDYLGIPHS